MTNDDRHEDELIEETLASLERRAPAEGGARGATARGADAETLVRLYTEVLGLVAYDVPAETPSPVVRERLLALVRGDETVEVEGDEPKAAELRAAPPAAPFPTAAALFGPRGEPTPAPPLEPPAFLRPAERPARRWPLALAATVALAAVGLSAWLWLGMEQQSGEIGRLRAELRQERERIAELERSDAGDADLAALRALITSPAVEVTPLRPVEGEQAAPPDSRGVLYVAADRQHWFLAVEGLPPAGPERDYQLWFIAGGTPVSAGTFDSEPGAPSTLSATTMPAGTELAAITVEPAGGVPQPTGPMVLKGEEPRSIL